MLEVRGVVHGKTIELQEELGLPDGESVAVIVRRVLPPGEGIRRSAGSWADGGEELDRWLKDIYRSRRHVRPEPEL
jgi:hypothetical protein